MINSETPNIRTTKVKKKTESEKSSEIELREQTRERGHKISRTVYRLREMAHQLILEAEALEALLPRTEQPRNGPMVITHPLTGKKCYVKERKNCP
jgi:hypothetical protein